MILTIGLLFSLIAFVATRNWEKNRAKDEFKWRAERQMVLMWRVLDQKSEMVTQVRNIIIGAERLSMTNVQAILGDLRGRHGGIQKWEYAELVSGVDREKFEIKRREWLSPDFAIRDEKEKGDFIPAPIRDIYLPVLYSDPPNVAHAGLDLARFPLLLSSAFAARDTGDQQMFEAQDGHATVLCAVPKYFQKSLAAGDTPAPMRGLLICNFEIKTVLDEAFAENDLDLELLLEDRTKGFDSKILYQRLVDSTVPILSVSDFSKGIIYEQSNEVLNRQWVFAVRPALKWREAHAPLLCYAVLLGGSVVSILCAGYLQSLFRQRVRIDRKVVERTMELTAVNERLAREVERRNHAEAVLLQAQRIGGIGSWQRDLVTSELQWSEQTYRIFNQSPERFRLTLESFYALVHQDDKMALKQAVEAALQTKLPFRSEHRILWLDGTERLVEEHCEVIIDAAGQPIKLIGTVQDITEARQAAKTQHDLEVQLRQSKKMEAVGTLAGGIAHDFNNILCAILGNAELLRMEYPEDGRGGESVRQILQASHRARELVSKILTFSRPHDQKREPVRLQALIEETTSLLRSTLPARITITTRFAPHSIYVFAESGPLHQVLMNLCANAWHAIGDQNGMVTLSEDELSTSQPLAVVHGYLPPGRYAMLAVHDTGQGISPEHLERIFDPFFTTKPTGQGTGLGLAVVQGIVKSHDGGISVENHKGAGTTFRIYLPLIERPTPSLPATAPVAQMKGVGKILFVDDEQPLTTLARRVLGNAGYEVLAFVDSTLALAEFERDSGSFDAVVTDFSMPIVGGAELLHRIRQTGSQIPVLLTSGFIGEMTPEEVKKNGFFDIVHKPYNAQELLAAVARMIPASPPSKVSPLGRAGTLS